MCKSSSFLLFLCNLEETGSLKGSAYDTLTQLFMRACLIDPVQEPVLEA